MLNRVLLAAVALVVLGCSDSATVPLSRAPARRAHEGEGTEASADAQLDLRIERATLLAADQAFASASANTNFVDGIVAALAPNAIYVVLGASPGVVQGSSAIRDFLLANPANALSQLGWTAIRVDVSSDGTRGYSYGYTELTLPSGAVVPGKYHAFWSRQPDGTWRISAYKRVARAAGTISLTPPPGFETPTYKHYRYFPNTTVSSEVAAMMQADRAFSDLAQVVGNGDAFAEYAAEDGANAAGARSAEWLFGREAIRALHSTDPLGGFYWEPALGDAAASGDLGFTIGPVKVDVQNADGSVTTITVGEYFTIWKKQFTGEWLFVADG